MSTHSGPGHCSKAERHTGDTRKRPTGMDYEYQLRRSVYGAAAILLLTALSLGGRKKKSPEAFDVDRDLGPDCSRAPSARDEMKTMAFPAISEAGLGQDGMLASQDQHDHYHPGTTLYDIVTPTCELRSSRDGDGPSCVWCLRQSVGGQPLQRLRGASWP